MNLLKIQEENSQGGIVHYLYDKKENLVYEKESGQEGKNLVITTFAAIALRSVSHTDSSVH
ncbi:MAG: hypothetical protein HFG78_13725 [Hungatella sp.]|jgi:hypothetical protein|nr:hypothetical protein [Hungatella sp.]MCI9501556.1 hypothetical protein [Hungatella sp.]MCI9638001.1 hypothetical protein [Hungatella sp.]